MKTFSIHLLIYAFFFLSLNTNAAIISSSQSGDWNSGATWIGGVPPSSADDVIIQNGNNITVTAAASCNSVRINGASSTTTFTINSGITLSVVGNFYAVSGNNNCSIITNIDGNLTCNRFRSYAEFGFSNYNHLINGNGSISAISDALFLSRGQNAVFTINTDITVASSNGVAAQLTYTGNYSQTVNLNAKITAPSSFYFQAQGNSTGANTILNMNNSNAHIETKTIAMFDNGGVINSGASGGLITLTSGGTLNSDSKLTYGDIIIKDGTIISNGNINASNVLGDITINSGATLNANGNDLGLGGDLIVTGALSNTSTSKLTLNGGAAQVLNLSSSTTIAELAIENTSGGVTITGSDLTVTQQVSFDAVSSSNFNANGKLILANSNGTMANLGDLGNHTLSGNITCQFSTGALTNIGYRQISMPVSGIQMSDIQYDAATRPNGIQTWGFSGANSSPSGTVTSGYTFNASAANAAGNFDDGWTSWTSSSQTVGHALGSSHFVGPVSTGGLGTYSFDVTGPPNVGPITINSVNGSFAFDASKTGTLPPINLHYNWALVGNPFPSTISWSAVDAASTDLEATAYIFAQDGFGWTAATNIPPFQAFMVRADGGSPAVVFNETAKVTTQMALLKSIQENDFIELIISSAQTNHRSYAKVEFNSNYSDNYDSNEDAYRVKNPSPWPNVAFMSKDGSPLQINKVAPSVGGHKVMPINTLTYQSGNHTLTFDNLDNVEGCFVLEDLIENKQITLTPTNNTYTFFLSDTTTADRFNLHVYEFAQELITNNSSCYGSNSGMAELELFNLGSDYLISWIHENGTSIQTDFNATGKQSITDLAPGKYTVEVSSNGITCPATNEYFTIMEPGEIKTDFDFGTDSLLFFVHEEIEFNNLSTGDIMSYEWNFGDNITSSLMNPKHSYFTEGIYSVELTASNGNSDCDVNSKKVIQVMNGRVSVESSDAENTSVKQIENSLMLKSESMISEYEIIDLSGKALDSKNAIQNNSYAIDITGFDSGVYILVMKLDGGSSFTHKFYKK